MGDRNFLPLITSGRLGWLGTTPDTVRLIRSLFLCLPPLIFCRAFCVVISVASPCSLISDILYSEWREDGMLAGVASYLTALYGYIIILLYCYMVVAVSVISFQFLINNLMS